LVQGFAKAKKEVIKDAVKDQPRSHKATKTYTLGMDNLRNGKTANVKPTKASISNKQKHATERKSEQI